MRAPLLHFCVQSFHTPALSANIAFPLSPATTLIPTDSTETKCLNAKRWRWGGDCRVVLRFGQRPSPLPSALRESEWVGGKRREWEATQRVLQCRTGYLPSAPVRMNGLGGI